MAITARVQHCFQGNGGTSQDMYCNQFYFWHATETAATVDTWGPTLASRVHQLFVNPAGGQAIARYMSSHVDGNGGKTSIYEAGVTGPPIFTISDDALVGPSEYLVDLTGLHGTNVNLPEEVAVCLSYQAAHTDGNLPRRRGRIYLGPLNVAAIATGTTPYYKAVVSSEFIDTILLNALEIQTAAASNGWFWRVFSQMDGFAFNIINFSVDNAFDTVRGRGPAGSFRDTRPVT